MRRDASLNDFLWFFIFCLIFARLLRDLSDFYPFDFFPFSFSTVWPGTALGFSSNWITYIQALHLYILHCLTDPLPFIYPQYRIVHIDHYFHRFYIQSLMITSMYSPQSQLHTDIGWKSFPVLECICSRFSIFILQFYTKGNISLYVYI